MNTSQNPTKFFVFTLLVVAAFLLAACGVLPERVSVPPVQAIQACGVGDPEAVVIDGRRYNCADVENAMATLGAPLPATATPAATPGPAETALPGGDTTTADGPAAEDCSSLGSFQLVQTVPFGKPNDPILMNMDVGDPSLTAVIQAWDGKDAGTTFHGLVRQMNNLDFERQSITGTYFYFTGDQSAIDCRAQEMWVEAGGSAYRLYVGPGNAPEGWSKSYPAGWVMKAWAYTETPIQVEGWNPLTVQIGDAKHEYNGAGYGQFWNGTDASKVYHFVVQDGYLINAPKYQGTYYSISHPITDTDEARVLQMVGEVFLRDDNPTIFQYFCGADGEAPNGFVTATAGWTCGRQ